MSLKRGFFILIIFILIMPKITSQEINISNLTIEEKIGQMIIVKANEELSPEMVSLKIGGIFLNGNKKSKDFKKIIIESQEKSEIKLLVSTDMEGYWNPFSDYASKSFGEINTKKDAENLGKEHSRILLETGFNLDFSPVVESKNKVWPGRNFEGSDLERKEKIDSYIKSLQEKEIIATAKHYPGGSMEKNPHWRLVKSKIDKEDLENFNWAIESGVKAIMVGHAITYGEIDSKGKPSTVSPEVIGELRKKFSGIIITDDISMFGLRLKYLFNRNKMCVDLVKAGNDIILDSWKTKPKNVKKCIQAITDAVNSGEISEERINESVERILKVKGYKVV